MLTLEDGLVLYHGSYARVEEVDLSLCSPGKDFGRGFYLTTDYDQARSFVELSARKHAVRSGVELREGYVSRFRVIEPEALDFHAFKDADEEWLHFVAANRRDDLFLDLIPHFERFDVVAGKIANDQTARTLQLYVSEAFGAPGTKDADLLAITMLMPNRLSDQYCFRTRVAVERLIFEGSDCYEW